MKPNIIYARLSSMREFIHEKHDTAPTSTGFVCSAVWVCTRVAQTNQIRIDHVQHTRHIFLLHLTCSSKFTTNIRGFFILGEPK